jgi:PrtD family type I secretion system ABC transporter
MLFAKVLRAPIRFLSLTPPRTLEMSAPVERDLINRFLRRYRRYVVIVVIASVIVNLLVFTGSAYMLLVYDSVLPSQSEQTLWGLFAMLVLVYLLQGVLEQIRSEALLSIANGVHRDLVEPVHRAAVARSLQTQKESQGVQLIRDLDQVHTFLTGTGPVAIIDLPWVIVFMLVLASLHWALGATALVGTLALGGLALWTSRRSEDGTRRMLELSARRMAANQTELRFAEAAYSMGMRDRLLERAKVWDEDYLTNQSFLSRTVTRLGGVGRLFRLFLQSCMLTVGALLVIDGKASGGIIIASSILAGRALAPVDQALANARPMAAARAGWTRIVAAMSMYGTPADKSVALAAPARNLVANELWVVPPGAQNPVVAGVSLSLASGQALAIVGPSAAGKSTLIRALLGVWPIARGEIRIDGATHDQWNRETLGASFGYVPQSIELLEGTIGENIARFDPAADSEMVIDAARQAGMHEIILALPGGYDMQLSSGGIELSAGQRQRIALARALYGNPFIVILDEPNSNLDAAGDAALANAIEGVRARDGIVVMVTHRPATLGPISHVAILSAGKLVDFGERDAVLARQAQGRSEGQPAATPMGLVQSNRRPAKATQ